MGIALGEREDSNNLIAAALINSGCPRQTTTPLTGGVAGIDFGEKHLERERKQLPK